MMHGVELMASLAGGLRLTSQTGVDGERVFVVDELEGDGTPKPGTEERFRDAGLFAAIDAFHGRWVEAMPDDVARTVRHSVAWTVAIGERDARRLDDLLAADFEYVEHRDLGWPGGGRDEFIAATTANADTRDRWLLTTPRVESPQGTVATGGIWVSNFGEWQRYGEAAAVVIIDDDQVQRLEIYPEDDLDAAEARFHELT